MSIQNDAVCQGILCFIFQPGDALNCPLGDLPYLQGWVVSRCDQIFGCVALLCLESWQMISAASQYEIWILVSSTSGDQRDNQECYVMMS